MGVLGGLGAGLDTAVGHVRNAGRVLARIFAFWLTAFVATATLPFAKPSDFTSDLSLNVWLNHTIAVSTLRWLERYLLPPGETLIAVGPFDAFMVVMYVGAGLALLATMPYATYVVFRSLKVGVEDPETHEWITEAEHPFTHEKISSALRAHEHRVLRNLGALGIGLFLAGVAFGLWILPTLYGFAFSIQTAAGVSGTITLGGFLVTTAFFTLGLGLLFQVPTVAYGLGVAGILTSRTLRKHWQIAALGAVGAAFVISPGVGAGLIEFPIAALLFGLYGLSYYIVRGVERRRSQRSPAPEAMPDGQA